MKQLYTRWGERLDSEHILQEYPRPILIRNTDYTILNGEWEYTFTENSERPVEYGGKILVPFSPECILSGVARQLKPEEYLWYRKEILSERWNVKTERRHMLLHFGAVDQMCKVFVNDTLVTEHIGGYLPFSADITDYICEGKNELVVMVQDDSDTSYHARGKQKLESGGMFYTAQSGIWQSVWLEEVSDKWVKHIDTRIKKYVEKERSEGCLETVKIEIYVESNKINEKIPVEIEIRFPEIYSDSGSNLTETESFLQRLPEVMMTVQGKTNSWIEVEIPNPKCWNCEKPYLYYMHVKMQGYRPGNVCVDEVESYFAIRRFEIKNDRHNIPRMYLNGKEHFQKGVLDQGYWPDGLYTGPSDEALIFDICEMKQNGI